MVVSARSLLVGCVVLAACSTRHLAARPAPGGDAGAEPGGGRDGGPAPSACGPWRGDRQLGTDGDDQLLGLTIGASGEIIASGYEHGINGVTNIEPDGDARAVVLALDRDGSTRWKTTIDTTGTDTAEDVALDPASGSLFVIGRTSGALPGFVNSGQFDSFLALLDGHGQVGTLFQSGNERPQHPLRLGLASPRRALVAGFDDTYVFSNFVAADEDGFVASLDIAAAGVTQRWFQYANPARANRLTGVAVEPGDAGAVYVTGVAATGIFVQKLNADGTQAWKRGITNFGLDAANAVALSPLGYPVVAGATFGRVGPRSFGQEDAFLLALDPADGATLWTSQAGGPDSDYPTALAFDAAGNVYIAGETLGSVVVGVRNQGSLDVFAMKFAPGGQLLSSWQLGSAADEAATSLVVDSCGDAVVGGWSSGSLIPGSRSAGRDDMFIVRAPLD